MDETNSKLFRRQNATKKTHKSQQHRLFHLSFSYLSIIILGLYDQLQPGPDHRIYRNGQLFQASRLLLLQMLCMT